LWKGSVRVYSTIVTGVRVTTRRIYSTEEAAEKLGISKSTILRWLKQGRIEEVRRDRNGWRVFTAADIETIKKRVG
jgi:excisionase family DNA binding protein